MTGLDLAVIGNCTVASVISPAGRHVWFCFPRLDGDPVFNALLGGTAPAAGFLETQLRDQSGAVQRYLPNTAVLETVLADRDGGRVRVIDFCPRFRRYGRMFRPPMLVRRIEPLAGRGRASRSRCGRASTTAPARPGAASAATICASLARTWCCASPRTCRCRI